MIPTAPLRLPSTRLFLALGLLAALAMPALAQDSHYEHNQYGSTSALKAGAATGGARDSSATWYNPAGLGFIDNPSIAVSASAYRLGAINLGDFAGTGENVTSTPLSTVPLIASGLAMDDKAAPGHRFGFCLINRTVFTVSASERLRADKDVMDRGTAETAGDEDYVGSISVSESITEIWAGGSWAYRANEHVSFGVTLFAALRQQSSSFGAYARAVNPNTDGEVGTADLAEAYDYLNVRLLARIGIAFDFGPLKFGVAWTTPSVSVFGTGGLLFQFTFNNVDFDLDNTGDALVLEDNQRGLSTRFQSNMVLAFGIQYTIDEKVLLALDVKWYAAAGRFNIMDLASNNLEVGAGGGPAVLTTSDFTPTYKYSSVANVSFASVFIFDRSVSMVLGFNTDLSYAAETEGSGVDLYVTDYDLFHFTTGLIISEFGSKEDNLDKLVRQVSVGVVLSFGSGTAGQDTDFSNANEGNFLLGLDTEKTVDVGYFALTVILGYTQHF